MKRAKSRKKRQLHKQRKGHQKNFLGELFTRVITASDSVIKKLGLYNAMLDFFHNLEWTLHAAWHQNRFLFQKSMHQKSARRLKSV